MSAAKETPNVGPEMLAAVSLGLEAIFQHLTNPDPKIALRAVAELTKLLGVCARHNLSVGNTVPNTPPSGPVSISPAIPCEIVPDAPSNAPVPQTVAPTAKTEETSIKNVEAPPVLPRKPASAISNSSPTIPSFSTPRNLTTGPNDLDHAPLRTDRREEPRPGICAQAVH